MVVGRHWAAIIIIICTDVSPTRCGRSARKMKDPTGLARAKVKGVRRALGSDSGRMNQPYMATARHSPADTQNGRRGLMSPSRPPSVGPTRKPMAKAAPVQPKAPARSSGGMTSAI